MTDIKREAGGLAAPEGGRCRFGCPTIQRSQMRCPLCNGPVHEVEGRFQCAVSHEFNREEMAQQTNSRLSVALWMAIEALDNEASVLRRTVDHERAQEWADEAAAQALMLRDFASQNAPRDEGPSLFE